MPIIASLVKKYGEGVRKVEVLTATGPAADVSVGAGATADFSISISPELGTIEEVIVDRITGLPANILASQIDFTATSVTLRAVNPTAAAITITAGAITIRVVIIGH